MRPGLSDLVATELFPEQREKGGVFFLQALTKPPL